jgi:hypothetical protein
MAWRPADGRTDSLAAGIPPSLVLLLLLLLSVHALWGINRWGRQHRGGKVQREQRR